MRFFAKLTAHLDQVRLRHPAWSADPGHVSRGSAERGGGRSPTRVELDRRPGQVSWLVARAVTLQYR